MASQKKNADASQTEQVLVRMSPDLLARIDEARRRAQDLPSRAELMRRVMSDWLDEDEAKN